MPYNSKSELPSAIRDNLPDGAQDIYLESFNSAWDQYKDSSSRKNGSSREETSHRVAWSAVKRKYAKENDSWVKKEERDAKAYSS